MKFAVGKYYKHTTGIKMAIRGKLYTTLYGETLVAESTDRSDLKPVGQDESSAQNWTEITEEEWLKSWTR